MLTATGLVLPRPTLKAAQPPGTMEEAGASSYAPLHGRRSPMCSLGHVATQQLQQEQAQQGGHSSSGAAEKPVALSALDQLLQASRSGRSMQTSAAEALQGGHHR
jgi:hypothetical protein